MNESIRRTNPTSSPKRKERILRLLYPADFSVHKFEFILCPRGVKDNNRILSFWTIESIMARQRVQPRHINLQSSMKRGPACPEKFMSTPSQIVICSFWPACTAPCWSHLRRKTKESRLIVLFSTFHVRFTGTNLSFPSWVTCRQKLPSFA